MRKNLFPVLIFITMLCIGLIILFVQQLHADVLFFLYWTERIVKGSKLYIDIIDINTPITYYFNYPVISLSYLLNLPIILTFKIFVLIILAFVAFVSKKILSHSPLTLKEKKGIVYLIVLLFIFSGWDFGQREYLFLLMVTPYLITRFLHLTQKGFKPPTFLSILVAFMAACGLGFKPFFVLSFIAIETYILKSKRFKFYRKNEFIYLLLFLLVQFVIIYLFIPAFYSNFLIGLKTYPFYETGNRIILRFETIYIITAIIIFVYEKYYLKTLSRINAALIILIISTWILALLQKKGFYHYYFPANFLSLLYFSLFIYKSLAKRVYLNINPSYILVISFLSVLITFTLFVLVIRALDSPQTVERMKYNSLIKFTKEKANNKGIAVLSTSLFPFTLLQHDADVGWVTHYPNFWQLPGFYKKINLDISPYPYHKVSDMGTMEREFFNMTVDDLVVSKPNLIFILKNKYKEGFGMTTFDFYEYFSQDPRFSNLMKHYKLAFEEYGYDILILEEN
ncbi:MAG: hypothetical protein US60_C0016G0003 [Microgenomates group bacterium GW2011_GWC1_37_8]|uniref:Glycosyltransferase RgtA/B/C/D-like domain-containing protein n=1 Tax=Candidatus Woesebacteria bacterium GW2011_GWB1_38_8 TaxID=1618570 RepID=A0A0G0P8L9_9BACT|nr:MAG: hypothetical protein US60_C0016G0003 [Microgenomates group bacterium GW2011_GWC1_37_8]KKQ85641.1 MAG: hypothetical protein UT08_C0005G0092 [Candidatus Woesebacteria bacterium GW2011_GWB1_38_8]